jgi:hypothetical protein
MNKQPFTIEVTSVTDKRIINALKRRQYSENTEVNCPQGGVQQSYMPYNGNQYIAIERNIRHSITVEFYKLPAGYDFPLQLFVNTNNCIIEGKPFETTKKITFSII